MSKICANGFGFINEEDLETKSMIVFFFKNSTNQPAQILQQMSFLQLPTTEKNNTAYTVA